MNMQNEANVNLENSNIDDPRAAPLPYVIRITECGDLQRNAAFRSLEAKI
jgi:hypothetical protein